MGHFYNSLLDFLESLLLVFLNNSSLDSNYFTLCKNNYFGFFPSYISYLSVKSMNNGRAFVFFN